MVPGQAKACRSRAVGPVCCSRAERSATEPERCRQDCLQRRVVRQPARTRGRCLWVPKTSSGTIDLDFRWRGHDDEDGACRSPSSTLPLSVSSSCSVSHVDSNPVGAENSICTLTRTSAGPTTFARTTGATESRTSVTRRRSTLPPWTSSLVAASDEVFGTHTHLLVGASCPPLGFVVTHLSTLRHRRRHRGCGPGKPSPAC